MEIYLAQQTILFLQSLLVGALLAMLYDFFRISRMAIATSQAVVFVEDVVFCLLCSVVTFLFLLSSLHGNIRFFLLVGELLGAVLYFMTLSHLVLAASQAIIQFVYRVARFIFRYLLRPIWRLIYGIIRLILRPFHFLGEIFKKYLQKLKFGLKVRRIVLYNHCKGYFSNIRRNRRTKGRIEDGTKTEET